MKNSVKFIALMTAAVMSAAAVPAVCIYAANTTSSVSSSESVSRTVKYGKVTSISGTKIKLALGEYTQKTAPDGTQDGQTPPTPPDGNSNGGTPPEKPENDGNAPAQNGEQSPEKPDGDKPSGEAPNGEAPKGFGEFTESGKTLTVNVKNEKVLKKNGKSASLSDISEGDILKLTYSSENKIGSIEILSVGMDMPQGGKPDSSGMGMNEKGSIELSAKYSISSGSKKISSKTITETTADSSAVLVTNGASLKITDTTITKSGDTSNTDSSNFYGLNAAVTVQQDSSAAITGGTIMTDSEGSNAIFATGENAKITVSGTKIYTRSNSSRGLDATYGGSITASDMYIKTLGAHCAPVATDRGGGTIVVSSSKLFASGDGSPCIYSTGDITAESCSGKATGSQIAVVEGKNSIILKDCTLIGAGKNGVMLYQSTSGDAAVGTAAFTSENSTLKTTSSGPMFYITNTDAVINLKNTKLIFSSGELLNAAGNNTNNWGKVGSNGGNVTLNAESQTLKGNVTCDNISTVSMSLASSTVFTGAVDSGNTGDVTITLDKTSKWNVTADSYVTAIVDADSTFSNIVSNGHTIYYSTSDSRNSSLNGKTVTLSDGGKLVPVK